MGLSFSTSWIQRELIQAHGQSGSNQKSTGVRVSCGNVSLLKHEQSLEPSTMRRPRQFPTAPGENLRACRVGTEALSLIDMGRKVFGESHQGGHVAGNLTRDEARERARLLSVESYEVELD